MSQAQVQGENPKIERRTEHDVLLAFGSNLASSVGTPADTVKMAIQELAKRGAAIRVLSAMYSTPAFPAGNGPDFVNAAARIGAPWSAQETLAICHAVEAELGRTRTVRWGQRCVDIDLIAHDTHVLPDRDVFALWRDLPPEAQMQQTPSELILPHPRLQDRAFVLVPLADVAPDWRHPVSGLTLSQMFAALDPSDIASVRRLE